MCDPAATPEAITAAFRRKARVLHPDVPGTGDAAAFIRVKQAYDVLSDAYRRAAYDRSARAAVPAVARSVPGRGTRAPIASPVGPADGAVGRSRRGVLCGGGPGRGAVQPSPPDATATGAGHRDDRTRGARGRASAAARKRRRPAGGATTHYVRPAGDDAVLWLHDVARDTYLPAGHVAAFSPVQALRLVPQHGLVEIRLADGGSGFIDAARLAPGDRAIARRAYCAYNAGPSPRNGEILGRHGAGPAHVEISNRGAQPVVVKLRDASGQAAATVFVTPGDSAIVENLPDTVYRPEFATGELWSSACNSFTAGMRAQRFTYFAIAVRTVAAGDSAQPFRRSTAGGYFRRGSSNGNESGTTDEHGCTRMSPRLHPCASEFIRGSDRLVERQPLMAITLQESLRGLFYAPFYVALARDAYAAEGVEVRFVSSPRPGDAARNVMDGDGGCLLGRADARHAGLSAEPRLRPRLLRRGGDARPVPAARPRATPGICVARPVGRCASPR